MAISKKQKDTSKVSSKNKVPYTSDYRDWLLTRLQNLDLAAGYLTEALDGGEKAFLIAVRDVVEAQGGIGKLSESTNLNREGLYDMLSKKGNPRLSSLTCIFDSLGLRFSISKKEKKRRKAA